MPKKLVIVILVFLFAFVYSDEFSMQATVTVNPLPLDLDVNVTVLTDEVQGGSDLNFLVELSKKPGNEITVDLLYEVVKPKGKKEEIVLTQADSMQLTDFNSFQKSLFIPTEIKPGKYSLRVTATYFNQSDFDEEAVKIAKSMGKKSRGNSLPNVFLSMYIAIINLFI